MGRNKASFFPSISLANAMPIVADDLMEIAKTKDWEAISRGEPIRSANPTNRFCIFT